MSIPLRGQSHGTPDAAYEVAIRRGAQRPDFLRAYLKSLYADAATVGIRADVLVAQADLETGAFTSTYWTRDGNPAGLAAFDDGSSWGLTFSPEKAARAHVVHMLAYLGITPPDGWKAADARWLAVIDAGYFGSVTTTADLGNGRWATDPQYAAKIEARHAAYNFAPPTPIPSPSPAEEPVMATHRYILNMGHRNTDGGGATREQEFTILATQKLKAAIERRGGKAWIIQEEDGDANNTYCVGRGLQNAARLCVDLAKAVGGVDAYISMHYEGATHRIRGVFGIYPDALGLSPASSADIAANNPLDIRLAQTISRHVGKTGMPVRGDGTMSERASYVGGQGYRLGEMYGTIGFRDTTARVILEAGNYESPEDRALLWSPAWQDKYVNAIVDGLEEVFGAFPKPATTPAPAPVPEKPAAQYAAAAPVAELSDKRPFLVTSGGSTYVRADLVVKATKATPRLRYATANSEPIGDPIAAGETFSVDYVILNPDGSRYWYTPWGTRVKYEDTEIVSADAA